MKCKSVFCILSSLLAFIFFSAPLFSLPINEDDEFYRANGRVIKYFHSLEYCKERYYEAETAANKILNSSSTLTENDAHLIISWASLKTIKNLFEKVAVNRALIKKILIEEEQLPKAPVLSYASQFEIIHYLFNESNISENEIEIFLDHLVRREPSALLTLSDVDEFRAFLSPFYRCEKLRQSFRESYSTETETNNFCEGYKRISNLTSEEAHNIIFSIHHYGQKGKQEITL